MSHRLTQPTSALIVIALSACVTCQGCAFQAATPQPTPHSPLLASTATTHLEMQHQRAQFLNTSRASTAARKERATRRTPRRAPPAPGATVARKQEAARAPLPSLSILKKESVVQARATSAMQRDLLLKLDAHLKAMRSPLHDPKQPPSSIAELHQRCKKLGRVDFKNAPADAIVFFHNTHDANSDGRNNDWYTFAAIVKKGADATQRMELVDPTRPGDEPIMMSIAYPDMYTTEGGVVLNSHIRQPSKDDLPYTRYLAGELFAGSCAAGSS